MLLDLAEPEASLYIASNQEDSEKILQKCTKSNLRTILRHCSKLLKGTNVDMVEQTTIDYFDKYSDELGKGKLQKKE